MYNKKLENLLLKKKIKLGDYVEIESQGKKYSGVLMPGSKGDSFIIKLNNGYNIGIKSSKIRFLKKGTDSENKMTKIKYNKKLKKITIIHTGGTVASKIDYRTGGVVSSFKPEEILAMYPEIRDMANFDSIIIGNMLSENMTFKHYIKIAKEISKHIKKTDGIILTHGTDTMHYTSAALSFMLQNLPIPVIIVGAQRSSDRGSSDASMNLISATRFIIETDFKGIGICMHESISDKTCVILPPCKTRKLHASRRDAFISVNDSPIAKIGKEIEIFKKHEQKKYIEKTKLEDKVGILKIHPNIHTEQIEAFKKFKGVVIEGTGLGHAPITPCDKESSNNKKIYNALKSLAKSSVVVMSSQAIFGRVNMNVYSTGRDLIDIGIISANDMTTETAFVKLAWCLGQSKNKKDAIELFEKNICNEMSDSLKLDENIKKFS